MKVRYTRRALLDLSDEREMNATIVPVILCGGTGSRLWPMSRRLLPKQFLPLVGERTLFQDTALRTRGMKDCGAPVVVTNAEQRFR